MDSVILKGEIMKAGNFKTFSKYRETLELVLLQDGHLSGYAVEVILLAMDESYKLAKLEDSDNKVEQGVDFSSVL
jgi:hypothetical protein